MPAFLTPRIAKLLSLPALTVSLLLASPGANAATPAKAATQIAESTISQLVDRWTPFIQEAARRFNIAEDWITAVMRMESGGRTEIGGKPITSKAGAIGLMQVMPETYKDMRAQYGLGANPHDPHDNVLAGAAYLKWLHDRYGYPKMFAAYNAGPGTLEAQMAGKAKLPAETQAYVKGISRILGDPRLDDFRDDGRWQRLVRSEANSARAHAVAGELAGEVSHRVVVHRMKRAMLRRRRKPEEKSVLLESGNAVGDDLFGLRRRLPYHLPKRLERRALIGLDTG